MVWFETHCHLQDDRFKDDLPDVVARAKAAGVSSIVLATSNVPDSRTAVELALEHGLYCTVGIHPHDASTFDQDSREELEQLVRYADRQAEELGRDKVVVAIGEICLDYHNDYSPRDVQRRVFSEQMELAAKLGLPLVFHVREAFQDFFTLIEEAKNDQLFLQEDPGVVHCYSGSVEFAERLLPFGFLFGFDGPLTFKNAKTPVAVAKHLPLERLVIETDAPYLTPVPHRGKRNEPAFIPYIGEKMAEIRQIATEEVARITTENAIRLFRLNPQLLFA